MIHRQPNGVTTYNYLKYDLLEVGGRPNAFFGMSLVIDEYKFCPNFKNVLDWFDWLFDKVVNERSVFIGIDAAGSNSSNLKYSIQKFEECSADVEWLKSVLPNIFSVEAKTEILPIDGSFDYSKTGQIIGLNDHEDDTIVLEAFRKYPWVALAPEYPLLEGGGLGKAKKALNYRDFDSKLNEWNQALLPIAIDPSKAKKDSLDSMQKVVDESITNIVAYSKDIRNQEDKQLFLDLLQRFHQLKDNISAVIAKSGTEGGHANTQYCYSCKKYKDISEFRTPTATKCIECESKSPKPLTRRCRKCHKDLPLDLFAPGSDVCVNCARTKVDIKAIIYGSVVAAVIVVAILCYRSCSKTNPDSKHKDIQPNEVVVQIKNPTKNETDLVDTTTFAALVKSSDLERVFQYISDKRDKKNYYPQLHKMINGSLWRIIDVYPSSLKKSDIEEGIANYQIRNYSVLSAIDYSYDEKYWKDLVNAYVKISTYRTKTTLSPSEYSEGLKIIQKYPERFDSSWQDSIEAKRPKEEGDSKQNLTITISKLDKKYKELDKKNYTGESLNNISYTGTVGNFIVIQTNCGTISFSANGPFSDNKEKYNILKIELIKEGSFVYKVSGHDVTIVAKKAVPGMHL
jgi:hypothetical protein